VRQTARSQIAVAGIGLLAALGLWYVIFTVEAGIFWIKIAVSSTALAVLSLSVMGPRRRNMLAVRPRHLIVGLLSAGVLYLIFFVGARMLTAVSASAGAAIDSVYATRRDFPLWAVAVLLLLVTGPAEEIFWRGLVMRVAAGRLGAAAGLGMSSALYALVHIWTLNIPLMLAALVAGAFWGGLFLEERSLVPSIVSHSVWGVAIFVLFPVS
jgi:membrane protease YdiL (CAAX protease family)